MNTVQTPVPVGGRADPQPPARRPQAEPENALMNVLPPLLGAVVGVVILAGVGVMLAGQAGGLAALGSALIGAHSAWYLSRASAFVAYVLLWWSMLLGLSITSKAARLWPGGPAASALHEHASLLGLAFAVLHALVLLADTYIGYTLPQILIPFASSSMPLWVGFGQVALYAMALVTFSFYVRRWIGVRTWRTLHFLSFAVFVLALGHGVVSGTDTSTIWATLLYAGTGLSVLAMTFYRIVATRSVRPTVASVGA